MKQQLKISKMNLSHEIENYLRKNIIEGIIPEGEHLNEVILSKDLGISRGPVREAIKQLEIEGFVNTPLSGRTRVNRLTIQDIEDYRSLRCYLESEAIKRIINNCEDDPSYESWLQELKINIEKMDYNIKSNNLTAIDGLDQAFHESIITKSHSRTIIRMWSLVQVVMNSVMEVLKKYLTIDELNIYYNIHKGIYKAIEGRNIEEALNNTRKHFSRGKEFYKEYIR